MANAPIPLKKTLQGQIDKLNVLIKKTAPVTVKK